MTDPRVLQLLEDILESGRTPEDVCVDRPDLLWEVRERLRRCQDVDAQFDAMFPASGGVPAREAVMGAWVSSTRPSISNSTAQWH